MELWPTAQVITPLAAAEVALAPGQAQMGRRSQPISTSACGSRQADAMHVWNVVDNVARKSALLKVGPFIWCCGDFSIRLFPEALIDHKLRELTWQLQRS